MRSSFIGCELGADSAGEFAAAICAGGGSLLIAAGTSAGARTQIPIFGAHIVETRDYNRVPDRYMAWSSDASYPAVAKASAGQALSFFMRWMWTPAMRG